MESDHLFRLSVPTVFEEFFGLTDGFGGTSVPGLIRRRRASRHEGDYEIEPVIEKVAPVYDCPINSKHTLTTLPVEFMSDMHGEHRPKHFVSSGLPLCITAELKERIKKSDLIGAATIPGESRSGRFRGRRDRVACVVLKANCQDVLHTDSERRKPLCALRIGTNSLSGMR